MQMQAGGEVLLVEQLVEQMKVEKPVVRRSGFWEQLHFIQGYQADSRHEMITYHAYVGGSSRNSSYQTVTQVRP